MDGEEPVDALLEGVVLAALDGVELDVDGVEPVAAVPELPLPPEDAAPAINANKVKKVLRARCSAHTGSVTVCHI